VIRDRLPLALRERQRGSPGLGQVSFQVDSFEGNRPRARGDLLLRAEPVTVPVDAFMVAGQAGPDAEPIVEGPSAPARRIEIASRPTRLPLGVTQCHTSAGQFCLGPGRNLLPQCK
jgi:hypothetical protein